MITTAENKSYSTTDHLVFSKVRHDLQCKRGLMIDSNNNCIKNEVPRIAKADHNEE